MTSIFQGRGQAARPHGTSSPAGPTPVGATAVLDQHLQDSTGKHPSSWWSTTRTPGCAGSTPRKKFATLLDDAADRFLKDILPQGEVLGRPTGQPRASKSRPARGPHQHTRDRRQLPQLHYLDPRHERVWSFSYFRLQDEHGRPIGVCEAGLDITDRYVARRRLALLSRASASIGRTMDIRRTAGDLAELVVPECADAITVDIFEPVLDVQEP